MRKNREFVYVFIIVLYYLKCLYYCKWIDYDVF